MGIDYIKNLKIDKAANKITCQIADGNIRPLTYYKRELYSNRESFEEKYACLLRGIISQQLHFADYKNELHKIAHGSLYDLREIDNYYNDLTVLGTVGTYRKYKSKIEQILKEGTDNRKLEEIPSIYEERFILETNLETEIEEVCKSFNNMDSLFRLNKNLSNKDKIKIYNETLEKYSLKDRPLFVLKDKEKPNIKVSIYPFLEETRDNDMCLTYYILVNNDNYTKKYNSHFMISYLTSPYINENIKRYMYEYEYKFIQDTSNFMIDAEDLSDLKFMAKDTLFYENCRLPIIALRESGYILEITKDKGNLIASIYTSDNNIDKSTLVDRRELSNELDLDNIKNIEEIKENCRQIVVENLQIMKENHDSEEENEL